MNKLLVVLLLLAGLLPALARAETAADSVATGQPNLTSPDWLAGYLPPVILVAKPKGAEPIQKLFLEGLDRIRAVKAVRFDDFPANQRPAKLAERADLDHLPEKSADVGFWVLVSQTGHVVALFAAFSTNEEWTHNAALALAKSTFKPAQYNGRPVPILLPIYRGVDHSISIN